MLGLLATREWSEPGLRYSAADPYRFKSMLEDPYTESACTMIGIAPDELLPKAVEDFKMEVQPF